MTYDHCATRWGAALGPFQALVPFKELDKTTQEHRSLTHTESDSRKKREKNSPEEKKSVLGREWYDCEAEQEALREFNTSLNCVMKSCLKGSKI